MRRVATAVESYSIDKNTYAVTDGPASLIVPFVQPTYVKELPVADAWKTPPQYHATPAGKEYVIISAASDGRFERSAAEWLGPDAAKGLGPTSDPTADIVFAKCTFVQFPEESASPPPHRP